MALIESIITEKGIVTRDKVANAIDLLKTFEPIALSLDPQGYYLTYSGGKDSDTNLEICIRSGVKFTVNYNVTGIDPTSVIRHIKDTRKRLKSIGIPLYMHPPKKFNTGQFKGLYKNMWRLIIHKCIPPTRLKRYCCSDLKEHGGEGKLCVTGVRWDESLSRKSRRHLEIVTRKKEDKKLFNDNDEDRKQFESCTQKGKRVLNPIIDWDDFDVWRYLKSNNCKTCEMYNRGYKRIGCIGCPNSGTARIKEFAEYPQIYKQYLNAFRLMLENIRSKGGNISSWRNEHDVMEWWLEGSEKEQEQTEGQISMFQEDDE